MFTFVTFLTVSVFFFPSLSCSPLNATCDRYLDPDPLLLAATHGNGEEVNTVNPRFHALNQALVQLVSLPLHLTRNQPFHLSLSS